jgi:ABC-type antimicrobial peptide transport system permease subunit
MIRTGNVTPNFFRVLGARVLGAAPVSIFRLVVGQGLWLSGAGIALGVATALFMTTGMTKILVAVKPHDPVTFVSIALGFFAVAVLACWLPARRAAAVDPTTALREE